LRDFGLNFVILCDPARGEQMRKIAIVSLLAACAAGPACGNDSTAEFATGGLIFVKNDSVEMRAEDLFISTKEIRVSYKFFNRSDKDVTVHVAFPMPEVTQTDQDVALPSSDPVNLLDFVTRVNGRPVKAAVEQRGFVGETEHTVLLRELRLPLAPHASGVNKALDALPKGRQDELLRLKLVEIEEYDAGRGMERHLVARWSLRTTFYWQQTFPARKETLIEHRYKPSVGGSVMTGLAIPDDPGETRLADFKRKYCVEKNLVDAVERSKGGGSMPRFTEQRIEYILKTGANWSGPIQDFRLVVDKGDAKNLVSFCGDGVKKIGPTRFEMRKTNFTPEGNFAVLILKPIPAE
jgi:hypothetical protein